MNSPVERIKVSAKSREILIRVKRHTGLEHWNEICRIAVCRSLANPTPPPKWTKVAESNIEMDWKTFAGAFQQEFSALIILRAQKDGIDLSKREPIAEYFRSHLERGIASLQNLKNLSMI